MKTDTLKSALWGAVGGALALAIVGFSWGGWVTERTAKGRSEAAVVTALAPICATQFQQAPDAAAQQAVFTKKGSWEQKRLVETADWAKMPGSTDVAPGVAEACASLIANLKF
jgi:alpha/beta superfamily hydrolase